MYSTLNELFLNTENDDLAKIIDQIDLSDEREIEDVYAVITAYFLGWFEKPLKKKIYSLSWSAGQLFFFLRSEHDKKESWDVLNNVLHILHCEGKANGYDLRAEVFYSSVMFDLIDAFDVELPSDEANPSYEGIVLTGKDVVPAEWIAAIRESVADLEVSVEAHMSWVFSHDMCGWNYGYKTPEVICAEICGTDEAVVAEAKRRIDALHFVWEG